MKHTKGDRVKHPNKPEWGLGQVLEDSSSDNVRVFFVDAGEKQLSLAHITLQPVTGPAASHPVLDNLKLNRSDKTVEFVSLPRAISKFLERFPQGFYGQKYQEQERDYKVAAHELAHELLNKRSFSSMLKSQEFDEICKRAMQVANATMDFPRNRRHSGGYY